MRLLRRFLEHYEKRPAISPVVALFLATLIMIACVITIKSLVSLAGIEDGHGHLTLVLASPFVLYVWPTWAAASFLLWEQYMKFVGVYWLFGIRDDFAREKIARMIRLYEVTFSRR